MARKTISNNLFSKTTKEEKEPKVKSSPLSVYLTTDEKAELAGIAKDLGESTHAVMQFAMRESLRRYSAGEYEIKTEKVTRKTIKPL
jgi:hypothetical protein